MGAMLMPIRGNQPDSDIAREMATATDSTASERFTFRIGPLCEFGSTDFQHLFKQLLQVKLL